MNNLPALEVARQFTGPQAKLRWIFTHLRNVDNDQQHSARYDSALGGLEKIPLEVVTDGKDLPTRRLNCVLTFFQIGHARVHQYTLLHCASVENFNAGRRAIHGRDAPALLGQPKRVPACPAGQVQNSARFQTLRGFDQQRRGSRL